MTLAIFAALGISVYAVSQAMERKRREAFAQYALMHGLTFDAECVGPQRLARWYGLFQVGRNRTWRYAFQGSRGGASFTCFEYSYVTGGGRSSTTHYQAVMAWDHPGSGLPEFCLAPEGWWDRVKQRFGMQDFDFPEDQAFSDQYILQGANEAAVRGFFDGSKRAFLTSHPETHAAAAGLSLMWWRERRLPGPDELEAFFADGEAFRQAFLR